MMSSMKLMLVTLLDNLEEFLSRLSLLAVLVLQYLNWNSRQDGYCACHVPRPLQVGLSIFQVLAVAITGGVGGSPSSDLFWVCFYQDNHARVQGFKDLPGSAGPYAIVCSYKHVSVDDEGGVSGSLGDHSCGLFLYLRLEGNVLLAHVVPVNLNPMLFEKLIHDVSEIDNLERNLSLLGHSLQLLEDCCLADPRYTGYYDCCMQGLASHYPKRPLVPGYISVILSFTRICLMVEPDLLNPSICIPESMSCLETVFESIPPTSTHVTAKNTHASTKMSM